MSAYLLGLASLPAVLLAGFIFMSIGSWVAWWFGEEDRTGGKGFLHELRSRETDTWCTVQHCHRWPSETPWWLIRWAEPLRVWWCLRSPDRAPIVVIGDRP